MKAFFRKPFAYALVCAVVLVVFTGYVLLDTFVISRVITPEAASAAEAADAAADDTAKAASDTGSDTGTAVSTGTAAAGVTTDTAGTDAAAKITDQSYEDGNISVRIETIRVNETDVYIADVTIASPEYLKTALAGGVFGLNVCEKTSEIAADCGAILAVNGDYYGARKNGYVIKNGTLYRSSIRSDPQYEDLVIYQDGSFGIVLETEQSAESLIAAGAVQLFCFGPTLVQDGAVTVSAGDEVARSKSSNPRTAIGIVGPLHYIFAVSDGRSTQSVGLTLYELAGIMADYGCTIAYNLDGGGSSTMVFMGQVVNQPTTSGKSVSEREVSDIVCIGC